jgi:hypothetical protein
MNNSQHILSVHHFKENSSRILKIPLRQKLEHAWLIYAAFFSWHCIPSNKAPPSPLLPVEKQVNMSNLILPLLVQKGVGGGD